MNTRTTLQPLVADELDLLAALVPLQGARVIELGCGAAKLARALLQRFPTATLTGLEVDERQHAKNLAAPQERLSFVAGGAQAIPAPDASFDLALMLKSLHHVPLPQMAQALGEVARVLVPGGRLYVSEPVYAGDLNEIIRLFHDEGTVRAAAQRALDQALAGGPWRQEAERRFSMPVRFADFAEFERQVIGVTFADHRLDAELLARVRAAFESHLEPQGAFFLRPMHVRLLQRT